MKARIKREPELVLLYRLGNDTTHGALLRQLLQKHNIPYREITADMLAQTVGFCCGRTGYPGSGAAYEGAAPEDSIMVMSGFSAPRVNQLLDAVRIQKISGIDFTAVVTQSNINWTVLHLYETLKQEREKLGIIRYY